MFTVNVWSLRSIGCIIHFMCVAPLYGSYISVKWGDISGWWITMLGSGLWLSWRWVWMVDMSAFHGGLSVMVHKPGLCSLIHKHLQWKWCMCSGPLMWANFFLMSFEQWLWGGGGRCDMYFCRKRNSRQTCAIFIDFLLCYFAVPNMWT